MDDERDCYSSKQRITTIVKGRPRTTVPHAIQRARERYGLNLTISDLADLTEQCVRGYGLLARLDGGSEKHAVLGPGGIGLIVGYLPHGVLGVTAKNGIITTVLPKSAMNDIRQRLRELPRRPPLRQPKKKRKKSGY